MNESEKSRVSWWQTVPGILTAIAGLISAVAGLLVALHQVGLLGNKEKAAVGSIPATTSGDLARSRENVNKPDPSVALHSAKAYSITFPSGSEVMLRSRRADGTYKILAALVNNKNTRTLSVTFSVRLTNTGRSDLGFWSDSFRLIIDGVPRAPTNFLNTLVEARSAKEGDVIFDMPESAGSLVLSVANGEDTANIPLRLKKSE